MTLSSHSSHLLLSGDVTDSHLDSSFVSWIDLMSVSACCANASWKVASRKSAFTSELRATCLHFGHITVPDFVRRFTQPLQNVWSHGKTCGSVKISVQMMQFVNSSALVAMMRARTIFCGGDASTIHWISTCCYWCRLIAIWRVELEYPQSLLRLLQYILVWMMSFIKLAQCYFRVSMPSGLRTRAN